MFSLANRFDSLRSNKSQAPLAANLAAFSSEWSIPRLVCTLLFFTCYDLTTFFSLTCPHMANKISLLKILLIPNFLNGSIKSPGTVLLHIHTQFSRHLDSLCEQVFALGFATLSQGKHLSCLKEFWMNNFLCYPPSSRNNIPSVHGTVPSSYQGGMKVTQGKEKFAQPQRPPTKHKARTWPRSLSSQGKKYSCQVKGSEKSPSASLLRQAPQDTGWSHNMSCAIHHNHHVLHTSQMAAPKVSQNGAFKTPKLKEK